MASSACQNGRHGFHVAAASNAAARGTAVLLHLWVIAAAFNLRGGCRVRGGKGICRYWREMLSPSPPDKRGAILYASAPISSNCCWLLAGGVAVAGGQEWQLDTGLWFGRGGKEAQGVSCLPLVGFPTLGSFLRSAIRDLVCK